MLKLIIQMELTKEDTFECVIRLLEIGYKCPVALDFASGTNAGGGWRGMQTGTQEESLCRRSDLGILLEKKKYPIPVDGSHYVPSVLINKNIKLEMLKKPVKCSVIASELRSISERSDAYLQQRISALYEIAIVNKHDVIVLGAWGLGAFKETEDDADILAKNMKICAEKYSDKIKTVFAVFGNKKNYEAFQKVLIQ